MILLFAISWENWEIHGNTYTLTSKYIYVCVFVYTYNIYLHAIGHERVKPPEASKEVEQKHAGI